MSGFNGTPGPWVAVGYWVEHPDDDVADICTCNPADLGQEHLARSDDEIVANARLIAAAPELLALAERVAAMPDDLYSDDVLAMRATARVLLVRIKGEA